MEDDDVRLAVTGRLERHPWVPTDADLLPLVRARTELSGWDTTFSSLPGPRQELFGLLEAELTTGGAQSAGSGPELARLRVVPADPGAVHRYLPALGLVAEAALNRLGRATIERVEVRLPAAAPDPQSLPYLQAARSWFSAADPGAARDAELTSPADVPGALAALSGRHLDPFVLDPASARVRLPEPSVGAATWALAVVAAALRAIDARAVTLAVTLV